MGHSHIGKWRDYKLKKEANGYCATTTATISEKTNENDGDGEVHHEKGSKRMGLATSLCFR